MLRDLCDRRCEIDRRPHVRRMPWLGVGVYVGFGLVDFVLVPDVALQMLATRASLSALGLHRPASPTVRCC